MNKFKLFLCVLAFGLITCGFMYHESKPIAEDLPYLDGCPGEQMTTNYFQ